MYCPGQLTARSPFLRFTNEDSMGPSSYTANSNSICVTLQIVPQRMHGQESAVKTNYLLLFIKGVFVYTLSAPKHLNWWFAEPVHPDCKSAYNIWRYLCSATQLTGRCPGLSMRPVSDDVRLHWTRVSGITCKHLQRELLPSIRYEVHHTGICTHAHRHIQLATLGCTESGYPPWQAAACGSNHVRCATTQLIRESDQHTSTGPVSG